MFPRPVSCVHQLRSVRQIFIKFKVAVGCPVLHHRFPMTTVDILRGPGENGMIWIN